MLSPDANRNPEDQNQTDTVHLNIADTNNNNNNNNHVIINNMDALNAAVEMEEERDRNQMQVPPNPEGEESAPSTPRRLDDAVDVVLVDANSRVENEPPIRQRLRMGDVYPIMKNTIYSDEECDGEVQVTSKDCGARFIRYVNGLFQYLVRNAKLMGLILTTVILILFFKYSQQVVLKSVHTALDAHPGLEPSDELRSRVTAFSSEMQDFVNIAETVSWLFAQNGVLGYSLDSLKSGSFMEFLSGFQGSFNANVNTYVLYKLPNSQHWGRVNCNSQSMCSYTTENSEVIAYNGTNFNTELDRKSNVYWEEIFNINEIMEYPDGVWSRPRVYNDMFLGKSYRVISFYLPFAMVDGVATAIFGVDVSVSQLANAVNTTNENSEVIMTDMKFKAEEGGVFVLDTFDGSAFWENTAVQQVPSIRIKEIAEPILREQRGDWRKNFSFYAEGLIFQSLCMMDRWVLMSSAPLTLSAAMVEASFSGLISRYERLTSVVALAYSDCEASANGPKDSTFLESVTELEKSFGSKTRSIYIAYTLKGKATNGDSSSSSSSSSTSSSSSSSASSGSSSSSSSASSSSSSSSSSASSGSSSSSSHSSSSSSSSSGSSGSSSSSAAEASKTREAEQLADGNVIASTASWGACGCSITDETTKCYYTNSESVEYLFSGPSYSSSSDIKQIPFSEARRQSFISGTILSEANKNASKGYWTEPYLAYDSVTNNNIAALSYVLPFEWSKDGMVEKAAVFDLELEWLPDFLEVSILSGTLGVIMIDKRGEGTYMGSRGFVATNIYAARNTPNETVNRYTNALFEHAGSFDQPISFHLGPELVNYQIVDPHWGILEIIPAPVALQRYLPTPTVTSATDALRLIPTGETIVLFLYVGGILLAYFINLLILGCSKIGES